MLSNGVMNLANNMSMQALDRAVKPWITQVHGCREEGNGLANMGVAQIHCPTGERRPHPGEQRFYVTEPLFEGGPAGSVRRFRGIRIRLCADFPVAGGK